MYVLNYIGIYNKMAPIKINIKSSTADIEGQVSVLSQPAVESDAPTIDSAEQSDSAVNTAAPAAAAVDTVSDKSAEAAATAVKASEKVVSKDDDGKEMEVEESAEGKESDPKGAAPGQADSDLYEYEGDDVYFTNPTTKGTVV